MMFAVSVSLWHGPTSSASRLDKPRDQPVILRNNFLGFKLSSGRVLPLNRPIEVAIPRHLWKLRQQRMERS